MKQLAFILILSFLVSCFFLCRDTDFTFQRQENNTDKIRINGFFYYQDTNRSLADIYMLFQNGIVLRYNDSLINLLDTNYLVAPNELVYESKSYWGIYRIYGDSIEIQYWFPQSNSCVDVEIYKGIILNDTTYRLTSTTAIHRDHFIREGFISINKTFRFHQYSPKPDSVISFIP